MTFLGLILLAFGVAGSCHGPADKAYVRDWVQWLFCVVVACVGLAIVVRRIMNG